MWAAGRVKRAVTDEADLEEVYNTERPAGWSDLVEYETHPLFFTDSPVSYWFPLGAEDSHREG